MRRALTTDQVVTRLRNLVAADGNQKRVADQLGISPQYLGDILAAKRRPGRKVLRALNLVRVDMYASATGKES